MSSPAVSPVETTAVLHFGSIDEAQRLLGRRHELVRLLQAQGDVQVLARGDELRLTGPAEIVGAMERAVGALLSTVRAGGTIDADDMQEVVRRARLGEAPSADEFIYEQIRVANGMPPVRTRTAGQQRYVRAIRDHDITFGIGPAGTGKTYLAVAMAVNAFLAHRVDRLVLCRPAVEAGEALGFLPGDLKEKVDPYLRPLYDAVYDMLPFEMVEQLEHRSQIEVAPLAFMRGRTLNKCFVILDEAQNTTSEQMRMFLTRLGRESQAVITGDVTQIDLRDTSRSGLVEAERLLSGIEGMAFVHLGRQDVVRHRLVQDIIEAYEQRDAVDPELPFPEEEQV